MNKESEPTASSQLEKKLSHIEKQFQSYRDYATSLRTWLIGYGAGLLGFIFTQETDKKLVTNEILVSALIGIAV